MAAIDTFVRLIQDLRQGQLVDDTDPNNTVLNAYSSPFDQVSQSESVRSLTSQTRVWGDGKTYTAYDSSGNPFAAPSCGWLWGAGGRYTSGDPYSDLIMSDSPLAYYRLDDTTSAILDHSGNGFNGQSYGPNVVTNQTGALRYADTAISLNGMYSGDSYIAIPNLATSAMSHVSVEVWINFPHLNSNPRIIANSHTDGSNLGFELTLNYGTGTTSNSGFFAIGTGTGYGYCGWNATLQAGQWYHYVGTFDGTNVTAYINGVAVATTAHAGVMQPDVYPVNIGRNPAYQGDYFNGTVDEVAIYAYALTPAQVLAHYNAR